MTESGSEAGGIGRLGTAAAWVSAVCCLPYLVLKVIWTLGVPVGITDRSVLDSRGWVAANAVTAVIQLAGLLLVLALTRAWARRLPVWLLLFPVWVGTGLLLEVVVGAVLMVLVSLFAPPSQGSGAGIDQYQPWVFIMIYSAFAGQGIALAVAFACHVRARWGRWLGERTGEVLTRRTAWTRPRRGLHLQPIVLVVAVLAMAPAVVHGYWAVGGSFGRSGPQPQPASVLQATGVLSAGIAVVGLLGLAGRWGRRTRFWVPVALTWAGSGALAAFDGLNFTLKLLFAMFGAAGSGLGWSLTDTLVTIKVVIGISAAVVGGLVVKAALADAAEPVGT